MKNTVIWLISIFLMILVNLGSFISISRRLTEVFISIGIFWMGVLIGMIIEKSGD